jgi:Activator of Hsp90 ATPase homolog 1-like protein
MAAREKQDYRAKISVNVTPEEAFEKISRVQEWWGKNFEGKSSKVNDVFAVRFPSGDMYKIRIAELDPNEKIVWEVIDAFQSWVKNTSEWKGTKIVWEIKREKNGVSIDMAHKGLVPLECYNRCKIGWNYLTQESLSKFLTDGKGLPV